MFAHVLKNAKPPAPVALLKNPTSKFHTILKGGAGSGNFNHAGRPGEVGGSGGGGGGDAKPAFHDPSGMNKTGAAAPFVDKEGHVRSPALSVEERAIEQHFYDRINTNTPGLIEEYADLQKPDGKSATDGGRVVDPDLVKSLDPRFKADSNFAAAVHEPSSELSKKIFSKLLEDKAAAGSTAPTVFTAGGSGSGKGGSQGPALAAVKQGKPDAVFDSVLGNYNSAVSKIQEALDKTTAPVHIVYTNTPFEKAADMNATRDRAVREGTMVDAHLKASDNIRRLAEKYGTNPRVTISIVNNDRGKGEEYLGKLSDVPRYDKADLAARLSLANDTLYAEGKISKERYDHIKKPSYG